MEIGNIKKINIDTYLEDFSLQIGEICVIIFLWIISAVYNIAFFSTFDCYIEFFFSKFPTNNLCIDPLIFVLIIISIGSLILNFLKGLIPSLKAFLYISLFLTWYIVFFRNNSRYDFYRFLNSSVLYVDIFLFFIIYTITNFRAYSQELRKGGSLSIVEDIFDKGKESDDYYRDEYAEEIVKIISQTNSKNSISIAIFSEWGTGKTDFLERLKKHFESSTDSFDENIVIEFNPWRTIGKSEMIEDFFLLFSKKLEPYNKQVTKKIRNYSKRIFQTSENDLIKVFDAFVEEFIPDITVSEEFDLINEVILRTGKRLIIFIDDCDRLSGRELLQVFRLIRNSANFSNTIFVTTLDYKYTVKTISDTNEVSMVDEYLKKIFQLIIKLPVVKKIKFRNKIRELFQKDFPDPSDIDRIERLLRQLSYEENSLSNNTNVKREGLLEALLQSPRDVKIFYNSFKISYRLIGKEVELYDLALLELIKVANFDVYNLISKKEFLDIIEGRFSLKDGLLKDYLRNNNYNVSISEEIIEAASELLAESVSLSRERKSLGGFRYPINFDLFFSYKLQDNIISRDDFLNSLQNETDGFYQKIIKWNESKPKDLQNIFANFIPSNFEEFKKIVKSKLLIASNE